MKPALDVLMAVYVRELRGYFLAPLAWIFIAVFLVAVGSFTFDMGGFFRANQADLARFFVFHPWLYLVFLPAIGMRAWAEEQRVGTIELLLALPAPTWATVAGKFLAAWTVAFAALVMTLPFWFAVSWLGLPDHSAIACSYLMSFLLAGAVLALASAASAMTSNQVIAFVIAVVAAFLFTAAGAPMVSEGIASAFGPGAASAVAGFSLLEHFESAQRGVLELRSLVFYAAFTLLWLTLASFWVSARRSRG
jgi:ABC-2 type transport system permease protein